MRSLTTQTFVTNLLIALLAFVTSAILARWLGPSGRGQLAAIVLWPTLLTYLATFGLFDAIVYFAALPTARLERLVGSVLVVLAVQSALVVPIGYVLMPTLLRNYAESDIQLGRHFLLISPIALVTQYATSLLQGRLQIRTFNWVRLVIPVCYAGAAVAFRFTEMLSVGAMVHMLLALNVVVFVVVLLRTIQILGLIVPEVDLGFTRELLAYGSKTYVSSIAAQMNLQLDQTLIVLWLSPTQLGLYTAAVSAANVTQMLPQAVKIVLVPLVTGERTVALRVKSLTSSFRAYWTLSLAGAALLAAVVPLGLPLVYGRDFTGSVATAEVLLIGSVLLGAKTVLNAGTQALGDPWIGSKAELLALVVTVGALVLLVPSIGIVGAAIASVVAYGAALVLVTVGLRRSYGLEVSAMLRPDPGAVKRLLSSTAGSTLRKRQKP